MMNSARYVADCTLKSQAKPARYYPTRNKIQAGVKKLTGKNPRNLNQHLHS